MVRELSARKPEIILAAPMMYQCSQFSSFCKYCIFKQCPPWTDSDSDYSLLYILHLKNLVTFYLQTVYSVFLIK